jgi:hypothetical protein
VLYFAAMRGAGKSCLGVSVLAAAAFLLLPSAASAAVTIGSDLEPAAAQGNSCAPFPCTVANLSLPGADSTSPINGVVVRWRIRPVATDPETAVSLSVISPAGIGEFTMVSESRTRTITVAHDTQLTFATRQRIRAGDHIGLSAGERILATATAGPTTQYAQWSPPLGATPRSPTGSAGRELLLNADVEPDADADGFGDETQDDCPSAPGPRNGCETTAPETTITERPTKKVRTRRRKQKVRFKFVSSEPGSDFRCVVDDEPPVGCGSPYKEKFKRGRHSFAVQAVDSADNADPTPAAVEFKVKRKK